MNKKRKKKKQKEVNKMKKEKYWKSVPIKCGATRKTSINCSVYHESVNVDANMDRCMRYKMNLYGIYIYICMHRYAR